MSEKYTNYSPEFKAYVTKMIALDGHKMVDITKELNVPYSTLKRWMKEYRTKEQQAKSEGQRQLLTATEYKELYEKERKSKLELEEENDILKKAMHIFTQAKD